MPKAPKMIFPVSNNPIVTPSDVEVLSMWTDCNRTGNGKLFFWIARVVGSPARIYQKRGSPPQHLFDFDTMVTAREANLCTNYPVFNPKTGDCVIVPPRKQQHFTADVAAGRHLSQREFCAKAWAIERELNQDETG
jgi:hypothetical protein